MNCSILTAPAAPLCPCRECRTEMEAAFQQGLVPDRPGYWLVTCWNADCGMYGYTFAQPGYAEVNLSEYRKRS